MDKNNNIIPGGESINAENKQSDVQQVAEPVNNANPTTAQPLNVIPPYGYGAVPVYIPKPKEYFNMVTKDFVFAVLALITSISGISLSVWGGFNSGFSVSYIIFFALMTAYLCSKTCKIKLFPLVCGILSVACSLIFSISFNFAVSVFSFIIMFTLSAIWFASLCNKFDDNGDMGLIKSVLISVFKNAFVYPPQSIRSIVGKKENKNRVLFKVIVGLLCALPLLAIVLPLLIKSDAAFEELMKKVFGNAFESVIKVVLGVVVTPFVISYGFGLKKKEKKESNPGKFSGIDNVYIISFISVISAFYLIYLFSQISYFFSGFMGILPKGNFTVAEYARRGFFEMAAIAAINIAVIFASVILMGKKKKGSLAVKLISTFIGVFTLIIISTAVSKMILYIKSFGMTRLRITTSAFMIFLAAVTVAVIIRCYFKKAKVLRTAVISAAIVLLVLGVGDVDRFIANYNYNAYVSGTLNELDVYAIDDLGFSGVPYLVKIADGNYGDESKNAERCLATRIDMMYRDGYNYNYGVIPDKYEQNMGSWNYSRNNAFKVLDDYMQRTIDNK